MIHAMPKVNAEELGDLSTAIPWETGLRFESGCKKSWEDRSPEWRASYFGDKLFISLAP